MVACYNQRIATIIKAATVSLGGLNNVMMVCKKYDVFYVNASLGSSLGSGSFPQNRGRAKNSKKNSKHLRRSTRIRVPQLVT